MPKYLNIIKIVKEKPGFHSVQRIVPAYTLGVRDEDKHWGIMSVT